MNLAICIFFFNDTATTDIYTLSLHDALPIYIRSGGGARAIRRGPDKGEVAGEHPEHRTDRKSTRLNSSHTVISYAVFCLKKKIRLLMAAMTSRTSVGLNVPSS